MDESPLMHLATPLGAGRMLFRSMTATEEVGRLFEFSVLALDEDSTIAPAALLGKPAHVTLQLAVDGERRFHGIVCGMGLESAAGKYCGYRLVLRPWLWLLTRRTDTRVFQQKSVTQILKQVFEAFSADFEFRLGAQYPAYEYCVQYRETDFAFVSRLMEREGINYYFRHEKNKHTLVLVDAPQAHPPCPVQDSFPYRETGSADARAGVEAIGEWHAEHEIQSGAVALADYDFEQPGTSLLALSHAEREGASGKLEVYDHPGLYRTAVEGRRYAMLRLEELQCAYLRVQGACSVRALCAGHTFELKEHPRSDQNVRHLVLATRIEMRFPGYHSGEGGSSYHCAFTATTASERCRPPRATPRPRVAGVQTAVVVGPSGEEIHTDAHGRIKLQFHWDRHGKSDAESSCWVRVSQPLAGSGWGMLALPRIGQEVVVDFLEGDPDQPIVIGRVHNATHRPPYALPDHKTVATFKSRSSKGGGTNDFNELRFEDRKGGEYVRLQAQREYYQLVKNDAHYVTGNDLFGIVKRDRGELVERDASIVIGRHRLEQVDGNANFSVGKNHVVRAGADYGAAAGGNAAISAGKSVSLKAGMSMHLKAGMNFAAEGAANVHLKAGANVVIEGGAMLTLKAGAGSVVIGPQGVSITGPLVGINSGGAPGAGPGSNPDSPAAPQEPQPPQEAADPLPSS